MTVEVRYAGRTFVLPRGETVLDGLEKAGVDLPSSCRAGVCQFCMMRAVDGPVPRKAQEGLKDSLKQSGHFLACICRPEEPLGCTLAHVAAFRGFATIQEIRTIGPDIVLVRFTKPAGFDFAPGQFITLRREDGLGRSYSLACRAEQTPYFDIHVRRIPGGRMSAWLADEARPGRELWIEGPKGDCMYYPDEPDEALTLVGTGTGMAPLWAITQEALSRNHTGRITIYQGALTTDRLYLVEEFRNLAARHPNVSYERCVARGEPEDGLSIGDLKDLVLARLGAEAPRRIYLCGDAGFVRDLKKRLFLAGMSLKRIHADPFVGTDAS